MTDSRYDAIVIGAGHNGLVAATYLAKTGRRVLVLEAAATAGGAARTREFAPGFQVSSGAHLLTQLSPIVARDLALQKHGLRMAAGNLHTVALAEDGQHLVFDEDQLSGCSAQDTLAYREFYARNLKYTRVLNGFFSRRIPNLAQRSAADSLSLLRLGWGVRSLGREDMQELLRVGLMNIYDLANEHFDSELLKAAVSMDGILGSHMGPRSPNTVYGYLYRHLGDYFGMPGPAVVEGGMGALGEAFARSAAASSVEIRYQSVVERIIVGNGRATGVALRNGETITSDTVLSNADPKTTLRSLVGYRELDTGFARRIEHYRCSGVAAKVHLALDALPDFAGLNDHSTGNRLLLAPSMDYLERAFNAAKYGEFSAAPAMEISIPTVHDRSLAPAGKHVLSAIVQYAPHTLRAGWSNAREAFMQVVIDRLESYARGIGGLVRASELLTPADLQSEFLITGGHWHHGEIALDQALMMRPVPGAHQYATPIDGLYLCGAGSHPGGGIMGLAGRNAAREVIKREKAAQ